MRRFPVDWYGRPRDLPSCPPRRSSDLLSVAVSSRNVVTPLPTVLPSAASPLTESVALRTIVPPDWVFVPVSDCVPPEICKLPAPDTLPEKVPFAEVTSRVCEPSSNWPEPSSVLIEAPAEVPEMSKLPFAVTPEEVAIEPVPSRSSPAPAFTIVRPVKVFVPDRF